MYGLLEIKVFESVIARGRRMIRAVRDQNIRSLFAFWGTIFFRHGLSTVFIVTFLSCEQLHVIIFNYMVLYLLSTFSKINIQKKYFFSYHTPLERSVRVP